MPWLEAALSETASYPSAESLSTFESHIDAGFWIEEALEATGTCYVLDHCWVTPKATIAKVSTNENDAGARRPRHRPNGVTWTSSQTQLHRAGDETHPPAALHCLSTAVSKQLGFAGSQTLQVSPQVLPPHGW